MQPDWVDIREPHTGKLLMRYSPRRGLIEIQRRGVKTLVDLHQYEMVEPSRAEDSEVTRLLAKPSAL